MFVMWHHQTMIAINATGASGSGAGDGRGQNKCKVDLKLRKIIVIKDTEGAQACEPIANPESQKPKQNSLKKRRHLKELV